jgi:beta-lactam-binding protein with PASTA domain
MRRFTLLTIIGLFVVLTAATIYQVALVKGKPRTFVGPGLSPGPNQVILTNLVGRQRVEVLAELRSDGLRYEIRPVGDGNGDSDRVTKQDPGGGVLVERGSLVRLEVECVPAPCPKSSDGAENADPCSCGTD